MAYWQVKVRLTIEHESGRTQKVNEEYLVDAESATEAEKKIYTEFDGEHNFSVTSARETKIIKILE